MAMTGGKEYLLKSARTNYGNGNDTTYLYMYVKEKSQSSENNTTTIQVGIYIKSTYAIGSWTDFNGSYVGTSTSGEGCKSFDGTVPYGSGTRWLTENKEFTITHNTDGTKKVRLYWRLGVNSPWGQYVDPKGYVDVTLTKINQKAIITEAPDFTDNSTPTIRYSNPIGENVTSLEACVTFDGSAADVPYKTLDKKGNSFTFEFDATEKSTLRNHINSNPPSGEVYFCIRTIYGGNTYYNSVPVTLTIEEKEETKPDIILSVSPNNDTLSSDFSGMYIQGKSRVSGSISSSFKFGASSVSYVSSIDGTVISGQTFTSGIINKSGTRTVRSIVTDTRGFANTDAKTISVIPYGKPTVSPAYGENAVKCYRGGIGGVASDSSTRVYFKGKRQYYNVSQINKCTLRWRYKNDSDSWGNQPWYTIIPGTDTTTDSFSGLLMDNNGNEVVFPISNAYTIQIGVIDDIGESSYIDFPISTAGTPLHMGIGGKTVAVGGYCDTSLANTFQVYWDSVFHEDVSVRGNFDINSKEISLECGIRFGSNLSKLANIPSGVSFARYIHFVGSSDNYYILIDSTRKLFIGTQLNGDSTINWTEK